MSKKVSVKEQVHQDKIFGIIPDHGGIKRLSFFYEKDKTPEQLYEQELEEQKSEKNKMSPENLDQQESVEDEPNN